MVSDTARRKNITIKDVAADAHVSVAAVSKVMRDAYGVSDAMREKVQASMDRLGYRPKASARGMRGQTFTIGLVLPDLRNNFFADILTGINAAFERTQYQLLLGVSQSTVAVEGAVIDSMIDRQMDGVVLVGTTENIDHLSDIATEIPLVAIGHRAPPRVAFDTVNNDDRLGAMLAVEHLVENGYKSVGMLSLSSSSSTIVHEREVGYRQAMQVHGLEQHVSITRTGRTVREIGLSVARLLRSPNRPDALFCWSDLVAIEVISIATEMGLSIPNDLAIVGYDNTTHAQYAQNSLTSIDQSGELLGLQAARYLFERIEGRTTPQHFVVEPRLVPRRSSAPRN